jgi:hypothetical protein
MDELGNTVAEIERVCKGRADLYEQLLALLPMLRRIKQPKNSCVENT